MLTAAIAPVIALAIGSSARAETKTFSDTGTPWSEPTNWTPVGVPVTGDDVLITGGTANMRLDFDLSLNSITYSANTARMLGKVAFGGPDTILNLTNVPGSGTGSPSYIAVTQPGGMLTIDSLGTSGELVLQLGSDTTMAAAAGATLKIGADLLETGGSRNLTFGGGGIIEITGIHTHSGITARRLTVPVIPANQPESGPPLAKQLIISGADGNLANTSALWIEQGTSVVLDNTDHQSINRINDSAEIRMNGGSLVLNGHESTLATFENLGVLHVTGGANYIETGHNSLNRPAILNFTAQFVNGRYVLHFTTGGGGQVTFGTPPALSNGIIGPKAEVNGMDWATINSGGAVVPYTGYETSSNPADWGATDNVLVSSPSLTITGAKEVNTLNLQPLGGDILIHSDATLTTKGILVGGLGTATLEGTGALTSSNDELTMIVSNPATTLHVDRPIENPSPGLDLHVIKSGKGIVSIGTDWTYSGSATINEGKVVATQFANTIDSFIHLMDDGVLELEAGPTPLTVGGFDGGGEVRLHRGIIASRPVGTGGTITYSGRITGTGSFTSTGDGTLILTGVNDYTGETHVESGTIELAGAGEVQGSMLWVAGAVNREVKRMGGKIALRTGGDRINDAATIRMLDGSIALLGDGMAMPSSEQAGPLQFYGSRGSYYQIAAAGSSDLGFASLDYRDGTASFEIEPGSSIAFDSPPAFSGGMLGPWAVHNMTNWATISPAGDVAPFTAYETSPNPNDWSSTSNVLVDGLIVPIAMDKGLRTMKLANGGGVVVDGTLAVDGILSTGGGNSITGAGSITSRSARKDMLQWYADMGVTSIDARINNPNYGALDLTLAGAGKFKLNADNQLTGTIHVHPGGGLELGEHGQVTKAIVATTGPFNPGAWDKIIGGLAGSGSVTLSAGTTLSIGNNDKSTEFSGVMVGNGDIIKIGKGMLSLTGDNSYTGSTTVAQGTLVVNEIAGDMSVQGGATLLVGSRDIIVVVPGTAFKVGGGSTPWLPTVVVTAPGTILKTGNVGINEVLPDTKLQVSGRGTLELEAPAAHTGGTIVSGTLQMSGLTGGALPGTSAVSVRGGGTIIWRDDGDGAFITDRINDAAPLEMAGGTLHMTDTTQTESLGQIVLSSGDSRFSGKYYVAGVHHRAPGGTVHFAPDADGDITFASPLTLEHGIIGPWATVTDPATGHTEFASTQVAPGGYRVWPVPGYWTGSESTWDPTKNVEVTSDVTLSASRQANTLKVNAPPTGGSVTISPPTGIALRTNAILASGNVVIDGGNITPTTGRELIVQVPTTGDTVTLASNITDNGGGPVELVMSGEGTVILTGENNNLASAKVPRNVLKSFFQTGDKPTSAQFVIGSGGTLDVTAHNQTIGSLSGDGRVLLGENKLIVGLNGKSSTFDGDFIGTSSGSGGGGGGGIVKIGAGTLTLGGEISAPGELHVQNGRVRINELEAKLQAFGLLSSVRLGLGAANGGVEVAGSGDARIDIPIIVQGGGGTISTGGNLEITGGISGSGAVMFNPKEYTITKSTPWKHHDIQGRSPMTHTGPTTIDGVDLTLADAGTLANTSSITVTGGGRFQFPADPSRISATAPITLEGGRVLSIQNGTAPTPPTQAGSLNVKKYDNTVAYLVGDSVVHNDIIYQAVSFTGGSVNFQVDGSNRIFLASPPALSNGILNPGARFNDLDFATVDGAGQVVAYTGYQTNQNPAAWSAGDNVDLTGNVTIASDTEINTLRRAPAAVPRAASLINGAFLRVNGILSDGVEESITGDGAITPQDGYSSFVAVPDRANRKLIFAVPLVDNDGPVNLVKAGEGALELTVSPQHTGETIVGAGTLRLGVGVEIPDSPLSIAAGATVEVSGSSRLFIQESDGNIGLGTTIPTERLELHTDGDVLFRGEISGAGGIEKVGPHTLTITGDQAYTGATVISGGTLALDGGTLSTSSVAAGSLEKLTIKPEKGDEIQVMFVPKTSTTTLTGGTLELLDSSDVDAPMGRVGPVVLQRGANTIASGGILGLESLAKGGGATLGSGTTCSIPCNSGYTRVMLQQPTPLTNGIVGEWATTTSPAGIVDWATGDWAIFDGSVWQEIKSYQNYETSTNPLDWQSTDNVLVTAPPSAPIVISDTEVHTYKLQSGFIYATAPASAATPRVAGVLTTGVGDSGILGDGSLSAPDGAEELVIHAHGTGGNFRLGASIVDNDGPLHLVKTGPQTLRLEAASIHTGETIVNEGELQMGQFSSLLDSNVHLIDDRAILGLREYSATIGGLKGDGGAVELENGNTLTIDQAGDTSFSGTVTGNGSVTKSGNGSLSLYAFWTNEGQFRVEGGTVVLTGDGSMNHATNYGVAGQAFVLDGTRSHDDEVVKTRLSDSAPIEMTGGSLEFTTAALQPITTEVLGLMKAKEKGNRTKCSSNLRIISSGLERDPNSGATMTFDIDAPGAGVTFLSPPSETNGIIGGWAIVGTDFADVDVIQINHHGSTTSNNQAVWMPPDNVQITASPTIPAEGRTINSLQISGGATPSVLTLDGDLTIGSGGIISRFISGHGMVGQASLRPGGPELFVHVPDATHTFTIGATVADNAGGAVSLVKNGAGTMVLDSRAAYTGTTYINEGMLKLTTNVRGIRAADLDRDGALDIALADQMLGGLRGDGPIILGGKKLYVGNLPFSADDTYSGSFTGTGSVEKRGDGTLTLTGTSSMTGAMTIKGGRVMINRGSLPNLSGISITDGSLSVTNCGSVGSAPINIAGGTMEVTFTEKIKIKQEFGPVTMDRKESRIKPTLGNVVAGFGEVEYSLMKRNPTATVSFENIVPGVTDVSFATAPTLTHGILGGWATVNNFDWAAIDSGGAVVPYTGYTFSNDPATWTETQNIQMNGGGVVSSSKTVNSIKISPNPMLINIDGFSQLRVNAGILALGGVAKEITGTGTLTGPAGGGELIVTVGPSAGGALKIGTTITDNAGTIRLVKAGPGALELTGNNTYSGPTHINNGTLLIHSSANLGDGSATNDVILSGGTLKSAGGVLNAASRNVVLDGVGSFDPNGGTMHIQDVDSNGGLDRMIILSSEPTGHLVARHVRVHDVRIQGVTKAQVGLGNADNTSQMTRLAIDPGAQLDLSAGRLILVSGSFGEGSKIADAEAMIASGRNGALSAGGGFWEGNGIMTSGASTITGLVVATATDTGKTSFGGLAVEGDDVLVMLTYNGDANLSGFVDADDYFQIDSNYGKPASNARYFTGDFNYSGATDGDDYFVIDSAFAGQSDPFSPGGTPSLAGVSAVPEPAGAAVIALAAGMMARYRRRRA